MLCSVLSKEQGITVVAVCATYDAFIAQKVRCVVRMNMTARKGFTEPMQACMQ
jgi:hypothetical protein